MITAIEARAISERRNKEIVEEQINEIERLIQLATEAGEFFTVYSGEIKEETKKILVDNGYNIYDDDTVEWEFSIEDDPEEETQEKVEKFFTDDDEVEETTTSSDGPVTEEIYSDDDVE